MLLNIGTSVTWGTSPLAFWAQKSATEMEVARRKPLDQGCAPVGTFSVSQDYDILHNQMLENAFGYLCIYLYIYTYCIISEEIDKLVMT